MGKKTYGLYLGLSVFSLRYKFFCVFTGQVYPFINSEACCTAVIYSRVT